MPPPTPSPFDPRTWLPEPRRSPDPAPSSSEPPSPSRSWLDAWVDLTTWWVDPAITATQSMAAMRPEQALTQLVDGVARQFEGHRIDARVRGRRVRAVLDGIALVRKRVRSELTLELSEVDIDGTAFGEIDVRARSVGLGPGTTPTFTAEAIDVHGDVPLRAVVAFVDAAIPDWSLTVDHRDRVTARHRERDLTVRVEPVVHDGRVSVELRAVSWRGHGVGLPHWLRLDRSYPVPLEPGWTVEDATRHGGRVHVRLHGDAVREELDLQQLRSAILTTGPLRL